MLQSRYVEFSERTSKLGQCHRFQWATVFPCPWSSFRFTFLGNAQMFQRHLRHCHHFLDSEVWHSPPIFSSSLQCVPGGGRERAEAGGSEADLQNKGPGLSAPWPSQTTWWQDNNKGGVMLTMLGFAYTLTTDCCPQPYMIPQLNKVSSFGSWENHNLKAWKPHIAPMAFSYK